MTRSKSLAPVTHLLLLILIGGGLFLLLSLVYMGLPRLTGALSAEQLANDWVFLLGQAVTTALLLVAIAHVSLVLGWRETRAFWMMLILMCPVVWIMARLVPWQRVEPAWVRPVTMAMFLVWLVSLAILGSREWLESLRRPPELLLKGSGWATVLAAVVVPVRMGLMVYAPTPPVEVPASVRVQHVAVPPDYAGLANPFEEPQSCVVLEEIGPDPDTVRALVQSAVPNRATDWAQELMTNLPRLVHEVADQETDQEMAKRLREAGARCSVRDALEVFVELVAADRETPIGRPSQVLNDEFLRTGRDTIAELRAAVSAREDTNPTRERGQGSSSPSLTLRVSVGSELPVDRELARQAFVAFKTAEGRALYQINCRPCHGTKGSGDGPMAPGFTLRPVNFRDPQSLSALKPGEILWRIEQGAHDLPPQATPWDSSMPAWKHELDRELVWKIILGELSTAEVKLRAEAAGHSSPVNRQLSSVNRQSSSAGRTLPEKSWLDWPVPPKPAADEQRKPEFVTRGKYLYYWRCMPCHGVTGRGDGPAANTMWPRPRDFTTEGFERETLQPKFKFRTTKQGWLPTDEDLYRTIGRGLTGTAMEGWADVLSGEEIWQIIAFLKTLSAAWNDPEHIARNPNDAVVVKEYTEPGGSGPIVDFATLVPPPITPGLLREGEETFRRVQCWQCHGLEARGDGPALGQHHDDWGYRTWPQNLSNPFNFKAGHSIKEIYRTFTTSLDGSVMPVFPPTTLDPKDPKRGAHLQWALAAYIHRLVQQLPTDSPSALVLARQLYGELPDDPLDTRWDRIKGTVVPLSGQVLVPPRWQSPSVNQITVKAAFNSDRIAMWLRWDDRRPNVTDQAVRRTQPRRALALAGGPAGADREEVSGRHRGGPGRAVRMFGVESTRAGC
ncbi:MAG: c-type cytochrome [Planctomycetes bacterium]|nr:c-type cytochrome [Planctomycetota bacterium]